MLNKLDKIEVIILDNFVKNVDLLDEFFNDLQFDANDSIYQSTLKILHFSNKKRVEFALNNAKKEVVDFFNKYDITMINAHYNRHLNSISMFFKKKFY